MLKFWKGYATLLHATGLKDPTLNLFLGYEIQQSIAPLPAAPPPAAKSVGLVVKATASKSPPMQPDPRMNAAGVCDDQADSVTPDGQTVFSPSANRSGPAAKKRARTG